MTDSPTPVPNGTRARCLADLVAPAAAVSPGKVLPIVWIKLAVLAGLFSALNFWQYKVLAARWMHEDNWQHGWLIPFFSLYLLFARRQEFAAARRRTCLWGLPLMIAGIVIHVIGVYPLQNPYTSHLSMIPLLLGMVLYLAGPRVTSLCAVPIMFLVFALPFSETVYTSIAVPLQELAARGSAKILAAVGVDITVTASNLRLVSISDVPRDLTVAEACSGIRSLMAYLALGVAWAYLQERPKWQRLILALSAAPIAILTNVLRVTITCGMYVIDQPEFGQKFMHEFTGILMLLPAALMFWGLSKLLFSLFVEVDDGEQPPSGAPAAAPSAQEACP